jgi:hypothetical protein
MSKPCQSLAHIAFRCTLRPILERFRSASASFADGVIKSGFKDFAVEYVAKPFPLRLLILATDKKSDSSTDHFLNILLLEFLSGVVPICLESIAKQ